MGERSKPMGWKFPISFYLPIIKRIQLWLIYSDWKEGRRKREKVVSEKRREEDKKVEEKNWNCHFKLAAQFLPSTGLSYKAFYNAKMALSLHMYHFVTGFEDMIYYMRYKLHMFYYELVN